MIKSQKQFKNNNSIARDAALHFAVEKPSYLFVNESPDLTNQLYIRRNMVYWSVILLILGISWWSCVPASPNGQSELVDEGKSDIVRERVSENSLYQESIVELPASLEYHELDAGEISAPDMTPDIIVADQLSSDIDHAEGFCGALEEMSSGVQVHWLWHGGLMRSYQVYIPASYDRRNPMPLILNFHGLSSNALQQQLLSQMNQKAEKVGFIAVYPEGSSVPQSWNAGSCCNPASLLNIDDIGFVKALLDEISQKLCIDQKRVFATGMSNGALLTYRLACELSDRIAAFAAVAGVVVYSPCKPARPVPILAFHGTHDTLVPFGGNPMMGFMSSDDNIRFWAKINNCDMQSTRTYDQGDTYCETYAKCDKGVDVTLCVIKGGGHTWPGGFPVPSLGYTTNDINATDEMWKFFQRFPLP